jgi:hypothetical protein
MRHLHRLEGHSCRAISSISFENVVLTYFVLEHFWPSIPLRMLDSVWPVTLPLRKPGDVGHAGSVIMTRSNHDAIELLETS